MRAVRQNNGGYILMFALVFTAVVVITSGALIGYAQVNERAERQAVARQQALYLAEAGIDRAVDQLNENANYAGESDVPLGEGTFSVTVATIDQYTKRVTAAGTVARAGSAPVEREIQALVHINENTIAFSYGVQSGNGGFTMGNNSVVNGNVYSNGDVNGLGQITGDVTVAAGAAAAADQRWNVQRADFLFGNNNQRTSAAQSFVPTQTDTLTKVRFYLKKIGNPGNLTLRIMSDNGGSPSKTVLVNGSVSANLITNNYVFVDGSLDGSVGLTAGQTYWLMLTAAVNQNNYYSWGLDNSDGYGSNTGKYSANWNAGNPSWSAAGGDLNFETYLGGVVTTLSGITIGGNARATLMNGCAVTGNAYFDIGNTCVVQGQSFAGSVAPPPAPYPISNAQITAWKQAAEAGGVLVGDYTLANGQTAILGPKKIDGKLVVDNNSILYLSGPLWVQGDVELNSNAQVILHDSLGNSGTILIADYPPDTTLKGKMIIGNNASIVGNGRLGSHPLLISTYSGAGNAVDLSNNAANTIFFAPNGTITLNNNTGVKEMTAHKIVMSNNSVVDYESGLQNAHFSSGPGGSWQYKAGTYVIVK